MRRTSRSFVDPHPRRKRKKKRKWKKKNWLEPEVVGRGKADEEEEWKKRNSRDRNRSGTDGALRRLDNDAALQLGSGVFYCGRVERVGEELERVHGDAVDAQAPSADARRY